MMLKPKCPKYTLSNHLNRNSMFEKTQNVNYVEKEKISIFKNQKKYGIKHLTIIKYIII